MNKQFFEADQSQVAATLGFFFFFARPPLKRMVFQKCHHYGDLIVFFWPLDIVIIAISNKNPLTFLDLPSPEHVLGIFTLAKFFVEEEG